LVLPSRLLAVQQAFSSNPFTHRRWALRWALRKCPLGKYPPFLLPLHRMLLTQGARVPSSGQARPLLGPAPTPSLPRAHPVISRLWWAMWCVPWHLLPPLLASHLRFPGNTGGRDGTGQGSFWQADVRCRHPYSSSAGSPVLPGSFKTPLSTSLFPHFAASVLPLPRLGPLCRRLQGFCLLLWLRAFWASLPQLPPPLPPAFVARQACLSFLSVGLPPLVAAAATQTLPTRGGCGELPFL
jgi:hypothetical protein